MDDCTDLSLKMLGKSIKSIPLLIEGILKKMSYMINFGINDWTKIKIQFINKGIDFIDLPRVFKDRSVVSSIPDYFKNKGPPILCY